MRVKSELSAMLRGMADSVRALVRSDPQRAAAVLMETDALIKTGERYEELRLEVDRLFGVWFTLGEFGTDAAYRAERNYGDAVMELNDVIKEHAKARIEIRRLVEDT
jgi:hypothetical protein